MRALNARTEWNRYDFFETDPKTWKAGKVELEKTGNGAVEVRTEGRIDGFPARLRYVMEAGGRLTVDFDIEAAPEGRPAGLGLSFDLAGPAWMEWDRKALWTTYPDGHIGRPAGNIPLGPGTAEAYRQEPSGGWSLDAWDFFLQGIRPPEESSALLSNDERSLKENIRSLSLGFEAGPGRLSVAADWDRAARLKISPDSRYRLLVLTAWDYPDIDWGNLSRPFEFSGHRRGQVRLQLD